LIRTGACFAILAAVLIGPATGPGAKVQGQVEPQAEGGERTGSVRIGLLITSDALGTAARRGAELAVEVANRNGGFTGRPFALVVRSVEGPWGSGSKEIVDLLAEDDVPAVLGGLDGRTAHLAEQVAVKIQVSLVSPWASDPTLSQAFIPWFFRMVPDDRAQAAALVDEIFGDRQLERVAVLVADSYDARAMASAFNRLVEASGYDSAREIALPADTVQLESVTLELGRTSVDGVAIFGPYPYVDELVRALVRTRNAADMEVPIFAPLSVADDLQRLRAESILNEPARLSFAVVAPGHWTTREGELFSDSFERMYGEPPPAVAAYAYDGTNIIIEAIRNVGLDRQDIRDALSSIDVPSGVTGRIRFDATGERITTVKLDTVMVGTGMPK
jgi:branched-chain amino acid transport system substrate-binding protein